VHFRKVTLVGVGLMGGSLGLALKKRGLVGEVWGFVRRPEAVAECLALGVVDRANRSLSAAVAGADLVVLCSPLGEMPALVAEMAPHLAPGATVTDVGSVKASLVDQVEPVVQRAGAHFVGSHPMAGTEKSGPAHARVDLFEKAVCIVTPTAQSDSATVRTVSGLWEAVGGRVLSMTPAMHDDLVSRASHLPHVVAAELANYVLSPAHPKEQAQVCAGGFRDTTRIAAGSPVMWRDISMANRQNLARVLGVFIEDLQEFQRALSEGDVAAIEEFFKQARARREAWSQGAAAHVTPE
jgi:prephenate dehydrogenase